MADHSPGGSVAPHIADYHGSVAGVVCLDSPRVEVDLDDPRHLRYAIEPDGDLDEEQEAELEAVREGRERVSAGTATQTTDFAGDQAGGTTAGRTATSLSAQRPSSGPYSSPRRA